MSWIQSNPVYPVADVDASIDWYHRNFGFEPVVVNPPGDVPVYAVLHRDDVALHLLRSDEAPHDLHGPVQTQFVIDDDLDALFERVREMGAEVVQPPTDQQWGHRDFMVKDPDRNLVWVSVRLARA